MPLIGLVDVDQTKFPNLVLMKLSAYFKAQGYETELMKPADVMLGLNLFKSFGKLYGACTFTKNAAIAKALEGQGVHIAGTGTGKKEVLPQNIEHIMPDYSLYGIKDAAYGFLTRGCPRGCPFCIVAGKEGKRSRKVADLSEWWDGQTNIVLLDPNLLACEDRTELLQQLADSGARVDFSQGLDVRLMDDEAIEAINCIKTSMLHFAWDNPKDTHTKECLANVAKKLKLQDDRKRRVYVLTNFWSTFEEDLARVYWLRENGYDPFVMVYEKDTAPRQIRRLQRWCNNKFIFRTCKRFEDYDESKG